MSAGRREVRRERILDAASVEIARSGYFRTTISAIAGRAGIADGTIYLYFENKEAILVSIFERAMPAHHRRGPADRRGARRRRPGQAPPPGRTAPVPRRDGPGHGGDHPGRAAAQPPLPRVVLAERIREYLGLIAQLDDAVGAVLDRLRSQALENDTLVVFTSDNGGSGPGNNGPCLNTLV